jgi:hypothetical protein
VAIPSKKKQLIVLLIVAAWISVAFWDAISVYKPWEQELGPSMPDLLMTGFVHSIPAILFGGVLFWWLGKNADRA